MDDDVQEPLLKVNFEDQSASGPWTINGLMPDLRDIVEQFFPDGNDSPDFDIELIHFPSQRKKKQERKKNVPSVQKVERDEAIIQLHFHDQDHLKYVQSIEIKVQNDYRKQLTKVKSLQWRIILGVQTIRIEFQLNNVEDNDIYRLPKSPAMEKKQFSCSIDVHFKHGPTKTKWTEPFYLLGSENKTKNKADSDQFNEFGDQTNRTKSNSFNSVSSHDSGVGHSPDSYNSHGNHEPNTAEFTNLIAQSIATESLKIGDNYYGQTIQSSGHDIAYSFDLKYDDEEFEEGEVVGFVPKTEDIDVESDGNIHRQVVITKLTSDTAKQAVLKGVITRSQFLEAYCPPKDSNKRTEKLCMLGIVPVKVIKSVQINEFLYASKDEPGYAISGYHLKASELKEATVIGVALSARNTNNSMTGLVEAGVSILQTAAQHIVNEKLRMVEEGFDVEIVDVRKSAKRWRKCYVGFAISFLVFLALLGVFLWQLLCPGSAYRFWKCKRGHAVPLQTSTFMYIPLNKPWMLVEVNGIKFEFDSLMKKMDYHDIPKIPSVYDHILIGKARYYLNINRCAYGNDFEYVTPSGRHIYRGPNIFAVDEKCYYSFYYHDRLNFWARYMSTSWPEKQNIVCVPRSPWKTNTTKIEKAELIDERELLKFQNATY